MADSIKYERDMPEFDFVLPDNFKQFRLETQFNLFKKITDDPIAAAILLLSSKVDDLWDVISKWERF